jgi:hypothetical protein
MLAAPRPSPSSLHGTGRRHHPKGDVMSKPAILTVDDDPLGSAPIGRDLLRHHGADYRVHRYRATR